MFNFRIVRHCHKLLFATLTHGLFDEIRTDVALACKFKFGKFWNLDDEHLCTCCDDSYINDIMES